MQDMTSSPAQAGGGAMPRADRGASSAPAGETILQLRDITKEFPA